VVVCGRLSRSQILDATKHRDELMLGFSSPALVQQSQGRLGGASWLEATKLRDPRYRTLSRLLDYSTPPALRNMPTISE